MFVNFKCSRIVFFKFQFVFSTIEARMQTDATSQNGVSMMRNLINIIMVSKPLVVEKQ